MKSISRHHDSSWKAGGAVAGRGEFEPSSRHLMTVSRQAHSLLLSSVPIQGTRIKSGLVERRAVHANVIWRKREMILTNDSILFSRPDSNIVVDQISIQNIASVGKVDNLESKSAVPKLNVSKESNKNDQLNQRLANRRRSSLISSESLESLQEFLRQTHAFEIKTCADAQLRSYFVRVDSSEECDDWIDKIRRGVTAAKSEHASRRSWLQARQQAARDLYDHRWVRYLIAAAIIIDFLSSVFESEFIQVVFPSLAQFDDAPLCPAALHERRRDAIEHRSPTRPSSASSPPSTSSCASSSPWSSPSTSSATGAPPAARPSSSASPAGSSY